MHEKNQVYVGKTVSVLVDRYEPPKIFGGLDTCYGNSREMKLTRFAAPKEYVGKIVDVKITKADMWVLEGELT